MRISKKTLIITFILAIMAFMLATYDLPYYVYKPGQANTLTTIVEVENGYESEGDLHLVTVSGAQATPIQYVAAKYLSFHEIVPLKEARPEGISDEEYMHHQLMLMENSQHSSIVVAYEAADKEVKIENNGIHVIHVVENMPADGIVEKGDIIKRVDGKDVKEANELVEYVQGKKQGETMDVLIYRNGEELITTIEVSEFPDDKAKVGIGIQLVTDQKVTVKPDVEFNSGKIGGPSAGLMFALEMYNQLTEEDITKGYHIAGTGEIDFDGKVRRIGGVDKKVVAAHRQGMDIFFAPNEEASEQSNYEVAKQTAEQINTTMEIVPVDTFQDALAYLEKKDPAIK